MSITLPHKQCGNIFSYYVADKYHFSQKSDSMHIHVEGSWRTINLMERTIWFRSIWHSSVHETNVKRIWIELSISMKSAGVKLFLDGKGSFSFHGSKMGAVGTSISIQQFSKSYLIDYITVVFISHLTNIYYEQLKASRSRSFQRRLENGFSSPFWGIWTLKIPLGDMILQKLLLDIRTACESVHLSRILHQTRVYWNLLNVL